MSSNVLKGFTIRPATIEDVEILHGLALAHDYAHHGEEEYTLSDVQMVLSGPKMNLKEDTRLAFDEDGRLVGMLVMDNNAYVKHFLTMRILPGYENPQLRAYLLACAEERASQQMSLAQPDARVTLNMGVTLKDQAALQFVKSAGFKEVRRFWRMEIEMGEAPVAAQWPAGIELRPFVPERDGRAVYEMIEAAFSDHWGFMSHSFEEWQHWTSRREHFDPTLWFIAYEGEQMAGASLCMMEGNLGWVDTLGILRPWRRRGLGLALLQHTFGEFYRRGKHRVGLGVDSESLTGATRLYERAGMHIVRENISFEKELRPGIELSTQTLAV